MMNEKKLAIKDLYLCLQIEVCKKRYLEGKLEGELLDSSSIRDVMDRVFGEDKKISLEMVSYLMEEIELNTLYYPEKDHFDSEMFKGIEKKFQNYRPVLARNIIFYSELLNRVDKDIVLVEFEEDKLRFFYHIHQIFYPTKVKERISEDRFDKLVKDRELVSDLFLLHKDIFPSFYLKAITKPIIRGLVEAFNKKLSAPENIRFLMEILETIDDISPNSEIDHVCQFPVLQPLINNYFVDKKKRFFLKSCK